ncbi:NB-ARC domain-containing protein [Abeliophyllum distichum]|uniref:NB-ARC domain-containing protein n=1 Tax=Abeliophyllum distichum TaxID=126358 RepID=A0ABD1PMG3_9LAMI
MAYAALRSLAQILHQTLNRDHQYLILDEKQQIESLVEKVSSIQDFLENSSQKIKLLERKIREASYIAEDIIETHITDRFLSESASHEDGILEKNPIRFDLIEKWIVSSSKPDFMDIKALLVRGSSELEEVIKIIPNIKKLEIHYEDEEVDREYYFPENLVHLHKLESLKWIKFKFGFSVSKKLNFPTSLKKLTLVQGNVFREDMSIAGSLPNLQVLKLKRFLLQSWRVDRTHFPSLERLVLKYCYGIGKIPDEIREIPTLRSIELYRCGGSILTLAKDIQEEQRILRNNDLQVLIVNPI